MITLNALLAALGTIISIGGPILRIVMDLIKELRSRKADQLEQRIQALEEERTLQQKYEDCLEENEDLRLVLNSR